MQHVTCANCGGAHPIWECLAIINQTNIYKLHKTPLPTQQTPTHKTKPYHQTLAPNAPTPIIPPKPTPQPKPPQTPNPKYAYILNLDDQELRQLRNAVMAETMRRKRAKPQKPKN